MNTEKLIRMANQIADFFRSYPEDQAVSMIRDHLKAFWTPRMRAALLACAAQNQGRLDPLVAQAMQRPDHRCHGEKAPSLDLPTLQARNGNGPDV